MENNKKRNTPSSTYHLYLGINNSFAKKVSALSKKLFDKYNTKFIIGETYVPHFTLYLFAAPIRNEKKLIEETRKISEYVKTTNLHASKLIRSYDGWLMVSVKESKLLKVIHEKALLRLNSLREGLVRKKYRNESEIIKLPVLERNNLKKYGDRHAKQNYDPHVSISEFEDINDSKAVYKIYQDYFSGMELKITSLELVKEMHGDASARGKILFKKIYE